ncbi:hypothetical protein [Parerythrobacter aestuarii]|uniref:hypothetical protein n=1 Tax=Parerythrobacter aestuarii TaxID=3020909 RepID=UPI0024DEE156|nr:hypothetical protein [Parerythrobacter aestuarii]
MQSVALSCSPPAEPELPLPSLVEASAPALQEGETAESHDARVAAWQRGLAIAERTWDITFGRRPGETTERHQRRLANLIANHAPIMRVGESDVAYEDRVKHAGWALQDRLAQDEYDRSVAERAAEKARQESLWDDAEIVMVLQVIDREELGPATTGYLMSNTVEVLGVLKGQVPVRRYRFAHSGEDDCGPTGHRFADLELGTVLAVYIRGGALWANSIIAEIERNDFRDPRLSPPDSRW